MDKSSQSPRNEEPGEVSVEALQFAPHFLDSEDHTVNQDASNLDESSLPPKKRVRQSILAYQEAVTSGSSKENINPTDSSQKEEGADDDQTIYCVCKDVFHGKMVLCDNTGCKIGWYHFPCVGIKKKPRGRWFCPQCRADQQKSKIQGRPGTSSEASCSKDVKKNTTYLCPLCNFICFLPEKLEAHKLSHSTQKLFKCEHCQFVTALESLLKNHVLKVHPPENNYQCAICKHRLEDAKTLADHTAAHEPDTVEYKDEQGRIRKFKCAMCRYKGITLKGLRSHVKVHAAGKSKKCSNKKYKVHDGFSCSFCDYKSSSIVLYKQHIGIHTTCSRCEYKCLTKQDLESHMRSIHPEDIASTSKADTAVIATKDVETDQKCDCESGCEKCNRGTPSNEVTANTVPPYYDQKLYQCRFCTCRFGILVELKDHIRTHKE